MPDLSVDCIIRIYRFKEDNPRHLLGVVEEVGVKGKKAFTNYDELWEILNAAGCFRRTVQRTKKPRLSRSQKITQRRIKPCQKSYLQTIFCAFFLHHLSAVMRSSGVERFSTPLTAPLYGAPPVKYSASKFVTIGFKTSPEVLRKLVPQPLVPNPDNLMGVYTSSLNTNDYQSGEFSFPGINYFEVALVIPVRFDKTAGNYCVVMYLDKTVAGVPMGREIWGLPKKGAQITFDEKDGKVSSIVSRFGSPIIKLDFERVQKVEPIPPRPSTPMFSLKYIPSVKKDAPPDVMQLTSYVSEWKRKEMWIGNGSVEFGSLPADPLGDIPVLQIVGDGTRWLKAACPMVMSSTTISPKKRSSNWKLK